MPLVSVCCWCPAGGLPANCHNTDRDGGCSVGNAWEIMDVAIVYGSDDWWRRVHCDCQCILVAVEVW